MKTIDNFSGLKECVIQECSHCKDGYCTKKLINLKCNVCIDNTSYINEVLSLQGLISKDINNYKFRKSQALKNFPKHNGLETRLNKVLASLDDLNKFLGVLIEEK